MMEEEILRSIEASFDVSKLVEAFSAVMKVVKAQNEEIASLREQLETVDDKFDNLEDYLHTLTDKTYGEPLHIKPYGDIPKSRLASRSSSPKFGDDYTIKNDSPTMLNSARGSNVNKSRGIAMKPLNLALSQTRNITDNYNIDQFAHDEYQSESGLNSARSAYQVSAREYYLASLKSSPIATSSGQIPSSSSSSSSAGSSSSSSGVAAVNEFQAIVKSIVKNAAVAEIPTAGKDLFDLSNLILTMESDSIQQILQSPQLLSSSMKPSSSFLSPSSSLKKNVTMSKSSPQIISSKAPIINKQHDDSDDVSSDDDNHVIDMTMKPLHPHNPANLTVNLIQDAVISTIVEGDVEDDHDDHEHDNDDYDEHEDDDEVIIINPNISTFEYTIVPTEAQLRKRSRINRVSRPVVETKRQMSIDRLDFLSKDRIDNILHELRVRGKFLEAIHSMMTAKNKKDRESKMPLRQRITELETSIETIFETLEHQKRNIRNAIVFAASTSQSQNPNAPPITSFPPPLASPFIQPPVMTRDKSIHVGNIKSPINMLASPVSSMLEPPKMSRGHSMVVGDAVNSNSNDRQPIKLDVFGRLPADIIATIKLQLDELNINKPPPILLVEDDSSSTSRSAIMSARLLPSTPSSVDFTWIKEQIASMKIKMATKQDVDDAIDMITHSSSLIASSRSRRNSAVALDELVPKMTRDQTQALIDEVRTVMEKKLVDQTTSYHKEHEELRHILLSKIGYVQEDMRKLQANMKLVVEELDLMNMKDDDDQNREGLTLRAQIKKMAGGLILQNEKQLKDYKELTLALQRLNSNIDGKPSINAVEKMVELTDSTFKRLLGQNITGVNTAVLQVVKAVQRKADKDEITKLIAKRVMELETKVKTTLESGDDAAGSTRCLSCGNFSKPKHMPPIFDTLDFDDQAPFKALSNMNHHDDLDHHHHHQQQHDDNQHDDDHQHQQHDDNHQHHLNDLSQLSVFSTGSISSPTQSAYQRNLRSRGSRDLAEPLYRRARQASNNKEAVKIPLRLTTPSLPSMIPNAYASNNQSQPSHHLYVLDPDQNDSNNPYVIFPELSQHSNGVSSARMNQTNATGVVSNGRGSSQ